MENNKKNKEPFRDTDKYLLKDWLVENKDKLSGRKTFIQMKSLADKQFPGKNVPIGAIKSICEVYGIETSRMGGRQKGGIRSWKQRAEDLEKRVAYLERFLKAFASDINYSYEEEEEEGEEESDEQE